MLSLTNEAIVMAAGGRGWDLTSFLTSATASIKGWGSLALILIGVVGIIIFAFKIWKGLTASQQSQPPRWGLWIVGLIFSGALSITGITLVSDIAAGGAQTIEDLGSGQGGSGRR